VLKRDVKLQLTHVLDGGADLSIIRGNVEGDRAAVAKYRDALP